MSGRRLKKYLRFPGPAGQPRNCVLEMHLCQAPQQCIPCPRWARNQAVSGWTDPCTHTCRMRCHNNLHYCCTPANAHVEVTRGEVHGKAFLAAVVCQMCGVYEHTQHHQSNAHSSLQCRQCVKQRHLHDVCWMSNQWPAHALEPLASIDLAIWLGVRGRLEVHFAVVLLIGRQLLGSLHQRI